MQDRRCTVWMPSEPPRTVFRSLARPANAEGLLHRRRGPPKRRTLFSVHRPRPHATGQLTRRRGLAPPARHRNSSAALFVIDPKTLFPKIIRYGIAAEEFR